MKINLLFEKEVDVKYLYCDIYVNYLEDGIVNGKKDCEEKISMPFIEKVKKEWRWKPLIDIDEGRIVDWPKGTTAEVFYKSVDDNIIYLLDEERNVISWFDDVEKEQVEYYDGYVPDVLDCIGEGYGDYVQMKIDEDGFIENFDKDEVEDLINNED